MSARRVWEGILPSLSHSVLAISFPPNLPLTDTFIPFAPNLNADCIALFIALLYEILLTNCWDIFSATKKLFVSGFFTSLILSVTSFEVRLDKLFLILSISLPFFPITKPGLEV